MDAIGVGKACASPTSELFGRFSRTRLYLQQFPHWGVLQQAEQGKARTALPPREKGIVLVFVVVKSTSHAGPLFPLP